MAKPKANGKDENPKADTAEPFAARKREGAMGGRYWFDRTQSWVLPRHKKRHDIYIISTIESFHCGVIHRTEAEDPSKLDPPRRKRQETSCGFVRQLIAVPHMI